MTTPAAPGRFDPCAELLNADARSDPVPADVRSRVGIGDGGEVAIEGPTQGCGDDLLSVLGQPIPVVRIEAALRDHPAVGEVAVIGRPDTDNGQVPIAFVVLCVGHRDEPTLLQQLREHVSRHLGPLGTPAEVFAVPDLPRSCSGGVNRRLLHDAAQHGSTAGAAVTGLPRAKVRPVPRSRWRTSA